MRRTINFVDYYGVSIHPTRHCQTLDGLLHGMACADRVVRELKGSKYDIERALESANRVMAEYAKAAEGFSATKHTEWLRSLKPGAGIYLATQSCAVVHRFFVSYDETSAEVIHSSGLDRESKPWGFIERIRAELVQQTCRDAMQVIVNQAVAESAPQTTKPVDTKIEWLKSLKPGDVVHLTNADASTVSVWYFASYDAGTTVVSLASACDGTNSLVSTAFRYGDWVFPTREAALSALGMAVE